MEWDRMYHPNNEFKKNFFSQVAAASECRIFIYDWSKTNREYSFLYQDGYPQDKDKSNIMLFQKEIVVQAASSISRVKWYNFTNKNPLRLSAVHPKPLVGIRLFAPNAIMTRTYTTRHFMRLIGSSAFVWLWKSLRLPRSDFTVHLIIIKSYVATRLYVRA